MSLTNEEKELLKSIDSLPTLKVEALPLSLIESIGKAKLNVSQEFTEAYRSSVEAGKVYSALTVTYVDFLDSIGATRYSTLEGLEQLKFLAERKLLLSKISTDSEGVVTIEETDCSKTLERFLECCNNVSSVEDVKALY